MSDDVHNLIIIGSGPAGYTAAIYAARANLSPILFAGIEKGGQLMTTTEVDNFPGFVEGIAGPDIMANFAAQADRFGTVVVDKDITKVDFNCKPFTVSTDSQTYKAHTVIISTGSKALYLGLENEEKLLGHGVSGCATCDGFFFKDKDVTVVGAGDSACTEALFLTKFCSKVTMIVRRDAMRASKIMAQKCIDHPKIDIKWDTVVDDVRDPKEGQVTGLLLRNVKSNETEEFACQGMFLGIGHKPATTIFEGQVDLDDKGHIVTDAYTHTSVPGIFAAGDVQDSRWRQAITSAGSGCAAALEAETYLEENGISE